MSSALLLLPLLQTLSASVPAEPATHAEESARVKASRPARILLEWTAGNLTLLGLTATPAFVFGQHSEPGFYVGMLGGAVVGSAASPAAVWGTGELLGGDGSVWGSYAGFVAPVLLGMAVGSIAGDGGTGFLIGALAAPTGAVIGYELTQRPHSAGAGARQAPSRRPQGLSLRPWIQPQLLEGRGAQLGVSGSF